MCHLPAQSVKNSYGHLGPAGTGAGGAQSTVPVPTTGTLAPGSGPVPTPTGPAREPSEGPVMIWWVVLQILMVFKDDQCL